MDKVTERFTSNWKTLFNHHGVGDFESLWNASLGFVDEPNIGRGGRSEVGKLILNDNSDKQQVFYVKRQVNYTSKTLAHPIAGIPLTLKEFNNVAAFKKLGIACMDSCYQGYRQHQGELQSILITPELEDYKDLDHYHPSSIQESRRIARALAEVLSTMHSAGYRHGCLYPKHIFVNPDNADAPVRLIDMEKTRHIPLKKYNQLKDLTTLYRRVKTNHSCNLYFLLCYFKRHRADTHIRQFIEKLNTRRAKRNKG